MEMRIQRSLIKVWSRESLSAEISSGFEEQYFVSVVQATPFSPDLYLLSLPRLHFQALYFPLLRTSFEEWPGYS